MILREDKFSVKIKSNPLRKNDTKLPCITSKSSLSLKKDSSAGFPALNSLINQGITYFGSNSGSGIRGTHRDTFIKVSTSFLQFPS